MISEASRVGPSLNDTTGLSAVDIDYNDDDGDDSDGGEALTIMVNRMMTMMVMTMSVMKICALGLWQLEVPCSTKSEVIFAPHKHYIAA